VWHADSRIRRRWRRVPVVVLRGEGHGDAQLEVLGTS
jgi:hypothetical protein